MPDRAFMDRSKQKSNVLYPEMDSTDETHFSFYPKKETSSHKVTVFSSHGRHRDKTPTSVAFG